MLALHPSRILAPLALLACAVLACNFIPGLPATSTPVPSAFAPGDPTFVPPAWLTGTPTPFQPASVVASPTSALPTATSTNPAATSTAIASPASPAPILGQHIVLGGETLFCIGRGYGVLPTAIAQVNGLDPNARLVVGQSLKIPATQWSDVAPGPVCPPQFKSPFPALPFVTYTPGPTASAPPEEAILILSPGPNSQITSPVTITGISDPVFENQLGVKILDESGKTVGAGTAFITAPLGERGPFEAVIEFTPPASPQAGRLILYDTSARDGHISHLSSVNVTLLPAGSAADLKPGVAHPEDIVIQSPAFLETVSGGVVRVGGIAAPIFEQTLVVDVLDGEGKVVGRAALIVPGEPGQPAHFEGEVAYTVAAEQRGAIQFYYTSPRDGGLVHLASVEVTLRP